MVDKPRQKSKLDVNWAKIKTSEEFFHPICNINNNYYKSHFSFTNSFANHNKDVYPYTDLQR